MTEHLGEALRSGMEEATGNVRVPAALVRRVVWRYRRRRTAIIAVIACIAAGGAAGGVAIAGQATVPVLRTPPTSSPEHGYTVAYVLHRSAQAASQQHLVEYARIVDLLASAKATHPYELSWTHGIEGISRTGMARREVIDGGKLQAQYETTWALGRITTTAIEYQTRTWYRSSEAYATAPQTSSCAPPSPDDYPAFLHWGLTCVRDLKIVGHATVDGVRTIKIASAASGTGSMTLQFWVNPRTYLPVRSVLKSKSTFPAADRADEQTAYEWLAPTRTSLASLSVRIPSGFTKDRFQPLVDLCGFTPCN